MHHAQIEHAVVATIEHLQQSQRLLSSPDQPGGQYYATAGFEIEASPPPPQGLARPLGARHINKLYFGQVCDQHDAVMQEVGEAIDAGGAIFDKGTLLDYGADTEGKLYRTEWVRNRYDLAWPIDSEIQVLKLVEFRSTPAMLPNVMRFHDRVSAALTKHRFTPNNTQLSFVLHDQSGLCVDPLAYGRYAVEFAKFHRALYPLFGSRLPVMHDCTPNKGNVISLENEFGPMRLEVKHIGQISLLPTVLAASMAIAAINQQDMTPAPADEPDLMAYAINYEIANSVIPGRDSMSAALGVVFCNGYFLNGEFRLPDATFYPGVLALDKKDIDTLKHAGFKASELEGKEPPDNVAKLFSEVTVRNGFLRIESRTLPHTVDMLAVRALRRYFGIRYPLDVRDVKPLPYISSEVIPAATTAQDLANWLEDRYLPIAEQVMPRSLATGLIEAALTT